jgi:septum formation topological specificity factor MinE
MENWREITEISGGWKISTEGNLKREGHDKVFYVQGRPQRKYIPEIRYTPADYVNGCLTMEINGKPMFYNIGELVAKHCVSNPNRYKYFQYRDGNPSNVKASNLVWTKTPDEKVEQVIQEKGEKHMGLLSWFGMKKPEEKIGEDTPVKEWNEALETSAEEVMAEISDEAVEKVKTEKKTKARISSKRIYCENTREYFDSVTEACQKLGLNRNSVYPAISSGKTVHGYKFVVADSNSIQSNINTPIEDIAETTDETWYSVPNYEGFEVSNTHKIRRQGKKGWSYLKVTQTKHGKHFASTTIGKDYKTFQIDDILAEVMNTEEPIAEVNFEVISVKSSISEEIKSILDNFDSYSSNQIKDRLNIILTMSKESENKVSDMISTLRETLDKFNMSSVSVEEETTAKKSESSEEKEQWRTSYLSTNYQVSNFGRYRRKLSSDEAKRKGEKYSYSDGVFHGGRKMFSFQINGKQKVVNAAKVILNSFNRTKFNRRVVFLNGDSTDVRLSNIAWKK